MLKSQSISGEVFQSAKTVVQALGQAATWSSSYIAEQLTSQCKEQSARKPVQCNQQIKQFWEIIQTISFKHSGKQLGPNIQPAKNQDSQPFHDITSVSIIIINQTTTSEQSSQYYNRRNNQSTEQSTSQC